MSHKRRKVCVLCQVQYEYIWEDREPWIERILCRNCFEAQGLGNYQGKVVQAESEQSSGVLGMQPM